ncbi:DUF4397 domain-containing protein [Vallicoccus soli]|uniref:DUF4397 domain-containing protein n=1 Tax=Vallicoccus soli TaxID=2339232 RepID=A0A3A3YU51_9ACTN|nr:DUF4397 domain-containing protein [Vallicoccus soli]RJK93779.1 DUF4397 domain-containing protein [Vallicoccus soli]
MLRRTSTLALAAAAGTAALGLGALPAVASSSGDATVTVIHGVALPDAATVDVWAGEEVLLDDFAYQDLETVSVPAGTYDLYVTAPDAEDTSAAIITAEGVEVPAGANASVVANAAGGTPNLAVFVNDTSAPEDGSARVTARHTADAPAVDVLVNGAPAFSGLEPLAEQSAEVPAGTVDVEVQAGGSAVPGLSAEGLALEPGVAYFAYAVGDGENGYALLTQTIDTGEGGAPGEVPAGDGSSAPAPYGYLALAGLGALVLGGAAVRVARR